MPKKKRGKAKKSAARKVTKGKRLRRRDSGPSGPRSEANPGLEPFALIEYEIITEPMPEPYYDHLTPEETEEFDRVGERLQREPRRCIEALELLLKKYPDFPKVYNYLSVAYNAAGRSKDALDLTEETYRRFPTYLFARINKALQCLQAGRADEVPAIFDHKFALHTLYPERQGKFHLSEFVQFSAVMAIYHSQIGKFDVAETYLDMAEQLDPEHPLVRLAGRIAHPPTLLDLMKSILPLGNGPRRMRRAP
jgi:tetratricopeptide (TPR) repeat protein